MVGSRLSPEETEVKVIPIVIPRLRIARGLMLLLAGLGSYFFYIWYKAQLYTWDDGTFGQLAITVIVTSLAFAFYEIYYGVKFIRIPTSNVLSFESNSILILSLLSEIIVTLFFLGLLGIYSTPLLILPLLHFTLYLICFLLEVRVLLSKYSSRTKRVPEFKDSYIPERYR